MNARSFPDLATLRASGKVGLARALAKLERGAGSLEAAELLDAAEAEPHGDVLGLTGPPGVGKSTLTGALVRAFRAQGRTVGVVAVDPSSMRSGGALLGDRARIPTDPDDRGVFVRSLAARDRLGGLSELAFGAVLLMRALFDRVIVETVGVGQSEADVALVADTILLAVQPASGDALQFIKAGVMELPDVMAVTKADLGLPAIRAREDLEGAMALTNPGTGRWRAPVTLVASETGEGLDTLVALIEEHAVFLREGGLRERRRAERSEARLRAGLRTKFGTVGLAACAAVLPGLSGGPFAREAEATRILSARLRGDGAA